MNNIHTNTIKNRWPRFSLAEQMSNIGSEVGRLISSRQKNNIEIMNSCGKRAIELINASILDQRWKGREQEFINLKMSIESLLETDTEDSIDPESIKRYFTPFFLLAKLE